MARITLPHKRRGTTYEAKLAGFKLYVRTGEYEDGRLGEVFVDVAKVGSFSRGMIHCWARLFSLCLQYGVPLGELVAMHLDVDFPPNGEVFGGDVKSAKSIVDYVVQLLRGVYLEDK